MFIIFISDLVKEIIFIQLYFIQDFLYTLLLMLDMEANITYSSIDFDLKINN